jgi:hypothetical protein
MAPGAPPSIKHGSRGSHSQQQDDDDGSHNSERMMVIRSRSLAASTTRARDVPWVDCGGTHAPRSAPGRLCRRARSNNGCRTSSRARASVCEKSAAGVGRLRSGPAIPAE